MGTGYGRARPQANLCTWRPAWGLVGRGPGRAASVWHVSPEGLLWVLASLLGALLREATATPPRVLEVSQDGLPGLALPTALPWASYPHL